MSWYHDIISPITAWGKSCEAEADKRAIICQAEAEHEVLVIRNKTIREGVKLTKTITGLTAQERKVLCNCTKSDWDWKV